MPGQKLKGVENDLRTSVQELQHANLQKHAHRHQKKSKPIGLLTFLAHQIFNTNRTNKNIDYAFPNKSICPTGEKRPITSWKSNVRYRKTEGLIEFFQNFGYVFRSRVTKPMFYLSKSLFSRIFAKWAHD